MRKLLHIVPVPFDFWNTVVFVVELLFLVPIIYWHPYDSLPDPGKAVAYIGVAAAAMTVHDNMTHFQRAVWIVVIVALLKIEMRSISKDRWDNEQKQNAEHKEEIGRSAALIHLEKDSFTRLLNTQRDSLNQILSKQDADVTSTLKTFNAGQRRNERSFSGVLDKEQALFHEQKDFSEQFAGRLVPGDLPTPSNACSNYVPVGSTKTVMIFGQSAGTTEHFPTGILDINEEEVLSVERVDNQEDLALHVEMRDNHHRILFRINKDGLVNPGGFLVLHPDKSTLLLQDPNGAEFLRAVFLNKHAVSVSGSILYCGHRVAVDSVAGLCGENPGRSIIGINEPQLACSAMQQP